MTAALTTHHSHHSPLSPPHHSQMVDYFKYVGKELDDESFSLVLNDLKDTAGRVQMLNVAIAVAE